MSAARITVRMMTRKKQPMLTHSTMVIWFTAAAPLQTGSSGGFA